MAGRRRALPALAAVVAAALLPLAPLAPAVSAPGEGVAGSPGVGDPYFPRAGNGGIDVQHYDLRLAYTPPRSPSRLVGRLSGVATIDLRATTDLRSFDLDLRGLRVRSVSVAGRPARFVQRRGELVVTPATVLRDGAEVAVRVVYGGRTGRPTDATGSLVGWVTTPDGAIAANEPDGAPTWFPANDHPTDDATFRTSVRVPRGKVAVANGVLESKRVSRRHVTWTWSAPEPMATYLATVTVGDFALRRSVAAGVPVLDAVDRDLPPSASAGLQRTGEMMAYFSGLLGPYPFSTYGAIVDDDPLGYALETQTRSLFTGGADELTVAHELAHQWLGDDVRVARWSDIWLNEGWATYLEQLWQSRRGGAGPQAAYEALLARPASDPMWRVPVDDPGPGQMFSDAVYLRGAAALHAMRLQIGDAAFFSVLRSWVATYGGRSATTADFERLAEEVSGAHLGDLFTTWLRTPRKPSV